MPLSPEEWKYALSEFRRQFLPYQLRWIDDQSRFRICEKAVRIGITYAHSFQSSLKRVFRHPEWKRSNEIFVSKNLKVAAEYLSYHRKWGEAWDALEPGVIDFS